MIIHRYSREMDHRRAVWRDDPRKEGALLAIRLLSAEGRTLAISYGSVGWTPPGLARAKDMGPSALSAPLAIDLATGLARAKGTIT